MNDILKFCIAFLIIGFGSMIFIIISYFFIIIINKKFGLDINGNKNNVSNNEKETVLRIENVMVDKKENIETNSISSNKRTEIDDDIPSFLKKNTSDLSIETSFNKNRIGKIKN